MSKIIKVGFIGFGNIGKKRFKIIESLKNYKTCILYKIDKTFKNNPNTNNFKSWKEVSKIKSDLIIISVPTNEVKKIPLSIFKNTRYLLIEKPLSTDINFVNKIKKICSKNKITLKTGYNLRFDDGLIRVKRLIKKNVIGNIYYIKINYSNGAVKTNTNNIGSLYDIGSHSINLLQWLLNKNNFSQYLKIIQTNELKNKAKDDNGFILMKIKKIAIQMQFGFCSWKNTFELEIVGSRGYIKIESLPKWGTQIVSLGKRTLPSGPPRIKIWKYKNDNSFKNEIKFILNNIKLNKFSKKINNEGYETLKCLKTISLK